MKKEAFISDRLRKPTLPFSHAVKAGEFLFTMGVGPINPKTGEVEGTTIEEQTKSSIENLKALLEDAGTSLDNVVKVTVYLSNIEDFIRFNEAYGAYFSENPPARSAIETPGLANPIFFGGIMIMLDAIAVLP